jgi:hypothetical protein
MDVERYTAAFLDAAQLLKVQRIVGLGGVYGELPYDKERLITATYSLPRLKSEMEPLAVNFSDYHGGASIGSYICRRSGEKGLEYVSFYALVPTYDLSNEPQIGSAIRIENDFMAWLNVMRRINYMLKINIDVSDLEEKSKYLIQLVDSKIEELDRLAPQFGVREYLKRLSDEFTEMPFNPEDIWEEELKRIINKFDTDKPA